MKSVKSLASSLLLSVGASSTFLLAPVVIAQSATPPAQQSQQQGQQQSQDQEAARVTYPAAFFEQYSPSTVSDMLNWIPGIGLALNSRGGGSSGGNERGLGNEENILINGERMAGKNNSGRSQLNRIPATDVDYIEILRGSTGDLAVRSDGQIINIVLKRALVNSTTTAELGLDLDHHGKFRQGLSMSYTRQQDRLNYLLSMTANPRYQILEGRERNYSALMAPRGTIFREEESDIFDIDLNSNISYDITEADRVTFNVQRFKPSAPVLIDRVVTDLTKNPVAVTYEREDIQDDDYNWEIGGNYEHQYAGGSVFRILGIVTESNQSRYRERFLRANAKAVEVKDLVLNTGSVAEERIVRGSLNWKIDDSQNLEIGAEAAQNILDSNLALGLLSAKGPATPRTGNLPASPVDNANSRVEENRYEPFVQHSWQITPSISLESALVAEFSEIEQTGDASKSRKFDFLKPSLDLRNDLTDTLQLRARVQKQVSQLNFEQFVASADSNDDQQNTEAGNPELAQEETWHYELNLEYRLPDDVGVVNLRAYYQDISNVIDRLDLRPTALRPVGATGNIGDAVKKGLGVDTSTRLGFLGMPEAIVTTALQLEDSSVRDPILGVDRRLQFHSRGSARVGFRHDVTAYNFNYGIDYRYNFNGGSRRFDVNRLENTLFDPTMTVFVEKTFFTDVVVNLESMNFLDNGSCRERRRFDRRISDPLPSLIENACTTTGRQYAIKFRTTF
jgi:outer membrane receptor for ferrienterochelin and colicin